MWTPVAKPTTPTWTNENASGREQYDQFDVTYDSADTFYDGINPNQWTDVSKPAYTLTWDQAVFSWDSFDNPWESPSWTVVEKPV